MQVKIGFSRGTTWFARAICYTTNTDISHSFFLVQSEAGDWVYEAHPWGFRRITWEAYQADNIIKSVVDMDWPHVEVKRALDAMLGMKYPIIAFFLLGIFIMTKRVIRRPERLVRESTDCVMSAVRLAKEYAKIDLGIVITPAELQDKLRKK
jgi:hypothetical protein